MFKRSRSSVNAIIFVNVLVFILWQTASASDPFMYLNFLVSWEALTEGRWWTLVSSVFSHNMLLHAFINLYVLSGFGSVIEGVLGTAAFLRFYFVAGIVSSVSHSLVSAFLLGEPQLPALGASGAIAGLVILFSFIFPKERLLVLGLIPIPALFGALVFIGLDLWGLFSQFEGGGLPIGHGAHLGGAFTGIIYYFLFLRGKIRTHIPH